MLTTTLAACDEATIIPDVPVSIPNDFVPRLRCLVSVDSQPAWLIRHERSDCRNAGFGGEHVSLLITLDGRLKGFTRMNLSVVGDLPSRDGAHGAAMTFLKQAAPDLLPRISVSWIKPHEETILANVNGAPSEQTVTGMKVKCRNDTDGRWFWVVVGADLQLVTFERDIVWSTSRCRQKTEKWLHDAWLIENAPTIDVGH